ncbi:zinc finger CCCH domain-containing protein 3 isoform X1 [Bombus flavifrons]|uniref:zinc finger CCCH domain-containing protein 3 isoform X1 n=1 Tax=Bombus flavifrons TaxID=103934 RepID=UPI003704371F
MLLNMDENLIKEIHYLTHLIENHKKKSSDKLCCVDKPIINQPLNSAKSEINLLHMSQQLPRTSSSMSCNVSTSTNVYINPNFNRQNSAIYVNPKLHKRSLVHVNPTMMKNINSNEDVQSNSVNITSTNSIQKSVHVNPKLIKKLSSSVQFKPAEHKEKVIQNIIHPVCSRLKLVKNTNSPKVIQNQKKVNNSSIVVLSQRKLLRVRRGSRKSFSTSQVEPCKIKRTSNSIVKNVKPTPQKVMKTKITNVLQQSINEDINLVKSPVIKPKINKYRIDRTASKTTNAREHASLGQKKTVYVSKINNKMELITIGGIVYKCSKNHLVRKSYGIKKKRAINLKVDKFIVATNGKKLCRVKSMKETSSSSSKKILNSTNAIKSPSNMSQKINYKNNISNKVKQKSIQILRNKMQKNNQPCLIFQKFGYCSNHEKGICVKRHDKKQISLCKKFLQGNCLLDKCPLSHDVGPEKMPTCKYFLEGCCTRDACPYRHIKVSSSTPICIDFLQGYCVKGSECKQRHENLCPEFEKTEKCSKGEFCPYPHKTQSSSKNQNHLKRKYNMHCSQTVTTVTKDTLSAENRLRYYEQAPALNKSLDKKKENIMRKINLMKNIDSVVRSNTLIEMSNNNTNSEINENSDELETVSDPKVLKRSPIGVLPAYIPID